MDLINKINRLLGEEKIMLRCMECGKRFSGGKFKEGKEKKCPKCKSTDVELD